MVAAIVLLKRNLWLAGYFSVSTTKRTVGALAKSATVGWPKRASPTNLWTRLKRKGEAAVKAWIDQELNGTGVTVVLIGRETASRPFVSYEIEESFRRKNGLLSNPYSPPQGQRQENVSQGTKPPRRFQHLGGPPMAKILGHKTEKRYSEIFQTFDWVRDDGRRHMAGWIEEAASSSGDSFMEDTGGRWGQGRAIDWPN